MHAIIAGCGRVGAQLASSLADDGHEVAVVDKRPTAFRRLGDDFKGRTVTGIAFDRTTLEEAGIRRAQAFVAVTNGDNSNIVAARTAQERYGVERVVARIYDPQRALIYERLGITTIASARWTAEAIMRELLPVGERVEGGLGPGPGAVVLVTLAVPPGASGVTAGDVEQPGQCVLAAVTRQGRTRLPERGELLQGGDQLHLAVDRGSLDEVRHRLAGLAESRT